jgi:hypothetical protein
MHMFEKSVLATPVEVADDGAAEGNVKMVTDVPLTQLTQADNMGVSLTQVPKKGAKIQIRLRKEKSSGVARSSFDLDTANSPFAAPPLQSVEEEANTKDEQEEVNMKDEEEEEEEEEEKEDTKEEEASMQDEEQEEEEEKEEEEDDQDEDFEPVKKQPLKRPASAFQLDSSDDNSDRSDDDSDRSEEPEVLKPKRLKTKASSSDSPTLNATEPKKRASRGKDSKAKTPKRKAPPKKSPKARKVKDEDDVRIPRSLSRGHDRARHNRDRWLEELPKPAEGDEDAFDLNRSVLHRIKWKRYVAPWPLCMQGCLSRLLAHAGSSLTRPTRSKRGPAEPPKPCACSALLPSISLSLCFVSAHR